MNAMLTANIAAAHDQERLRVADHHRRTTAPRGGKAGTSRMSRLTASLRSAATGGRRRAGSGRLSPTRPSAPSHATRPTACGTAPV
jgi:hypothetical protein